MACTSSEPKAAAAVATTFLDVHPDIMQTHILMRPDGPSLSSAASTCSELRDLSSHDHLWANACHKTWPSNMAPRASKVISTFPNGYRSFLADSFTYRRHSAATATSPRIILDRTPELISVVDLFHQHGRILSEVVETETVTGWFRDNPFQIYMQDPRKDVVRTLANHPVCEDTFHDLREDLRLSWIVIDPTGRRAINLSSEKAVSVQWDWFRREVQVRFDTAVDGESGTATELVLCKVVVVLGGENNLHVREVSLQMEDMEGKELDGWEGLVILKKVLEGERIRKENVGEGYHEYMKRRWR